jgi:hypothetical protein
MAAGFTLADPILIVAAAGILACVFARGAVHKLSDFDWFSYTLAEYRILPAALTKPAAGLLAVLEPAVALGLVFPQTRFPAALAAAFLLAVYAAAIAVNLMRGRSRVECGCGGSGQGLSWFLVARNAALVGFALVAAQTPAGGEIGLPGWITAAAAIGSIWLLLAASEKLGENWSWLAAADENAAREHMETH